MSILIVIVAVIAGLGAGGALAAHLLRQQRATSRELLQRLVTTNQSVFGAERDRTTAELDGKKSLIDQQLDAMAGRLEEVRDLVRVFEDDRGRVKEISTREYVDPAGGTVDFVLLFIPNEQLYTFIHETDETIVQDASRRRVVLCSPLTLLAVLALIRQTCENFQLARRSDEILGLLGHFFEQWEKFVGQMDTLGKRIDSTSREYEALVGTRKRMLEKRIGEINALRNDSRALTSVNEDDEDGEDDADDEGFGGSLALEA